MDKGMIALISAIIKEIDYKSANILHDLNLTKMEGVYLTIIHTTPGISQYDIARMQNADKSLIVKHITNLEKKEFIIKIEINSRKKGIYLTNNGEKAVEFIKKNLSSLEKELFSGINQGEIELFFELMLHIKNKLELSNEREHFAYNLKK